MKPAYENVNIYKVCLCRTEVQPTIDLFHVVTRCQKTTEGSCRLQGCKRFQQNSFQVQRFGGRVKVSSQGSKVKANGIRMFTWIDCSHQKEQTSKSVENLRKPQQREAEKTRTNYCNENSCLGVGKDGFHLINEAIPSPCHPKQ